MSPQVRLITLGGAGLEGPEGSIGGRVAQPQSIALLALLALGPGATTREKLLGYLWPEADQARGRHLLSNTVYHLRQQLGEEAIPGSGETLRLNRKLVAVDVDEFLDALSRNDLTRAEEVFRGPFLDGLYVSEAPDFERWVDSERSRLARTWAAALEKSVREHEARNDHAGAALRLATLAANDPFNSRVAVRLAQALRSAGDPAGALKALQRHASGLRADLALEPDQEVLTLIAELKPTSDAIPAVRHPRKSTNGHARSADRMGEGTNTQPTAAARYVALPKWLKAPRLLLFGGVALAVLLIVAVKALTDQTADHVARGMGRASGAPAELLIADFTAPASDTALGHLVTEALRTDFEGSSILRAYPVRAMDDALRRMELRAGASVRGPVARELAVREGLPLILEGNIHESGSEYVITARIVATSDNSTIATARAVAPVGRIIPAIDRLSGTLRLRAGESARNVRGSPPLDEVTTTSLEALQHYTLARRAMREGNDGAASLLLEQAVAKDSTFAMAAYYLTLARGPTVDEERAAGARAQAFRHRQKLPPLERYKVEGGYWWQEGEPERAAAAWESALHLRPRDVGMLNNLAVYYGPRVPAKFIEMATRAFHEDPGAPSSVVNYAVALFRQEKYDSARRVLHSSGPRTPAMAVLEATMLLTRGDYDGAERMLRVSWREAEGKPGRHMNVAWTLAGLTAITGRLKESIAWMTEARKSPGLSRADSLRVETVIARLEAFVGGDVNSARARLSRAIMRHQPGSIPIRSRPLLDVAHAFAGIEAFDKAKVALRQYEDSSPASLRWRQRTYHANVSGMLALAERDTVYAAAAFRTSGREGCAWCEHFGMAQLHTLSGRTDSAIVRLEQYLAVVDPFRWGEDSWWLPTALERLARLHEQRGDRVQAATYYDRFADLWQHADPQLQPRVRSARSAAAQLRIR